MQLFLILSFIVAALAVPAICDENQEYQTCGTACPLTCDNFDNPPKICNAMCLIGCQCKKGYVRTKDGRCVLPENCPNRAAAVCGENQEYQTCGTACPLTCDNYNNPPKMCNLMCVIGCQCKKGYVRTDDGQCTLPENCQNSSDEKNCVELPEPGFCRGKFASYYYDANQDDCVEGCGQNGNSYDTYDECRKACIDSKSWGSDVCNLPFEPGTGSDNLKRFGFNNALGECTRFVYTGEGGNGNNFESLEECRGVCGKAEHLPSACQQEKEVGECRAAVPRYFYNQETGECEFFIYGGCNGNSNNFNTKDDCEDVCKA